MSKKCPICKKRQTAILENIVAIDSILFNNKNPKKILTTENFKSYKQIKSALLLNLYEIYSVLNYFSENTYKDIPELNRKSLQTGKSIFNESISLLKEEDNLKLIENEINDYSEQNDSTKLEEVKSYVIKKSLYRTALDKLMLENAIISSNVNLLEHDKGKLLISAHKSLLNDLIDLSINN